MPEIHVEIRLKANWPTEAEMELRHVIEDAIEEQSIGEVVQAGSGLGIAELYVEVPESEAGTALKAIEAIAKANGAEQITKVTLLDDG